ncbi:MAG: hemolysin family protein [Candidatus Omnitrophota bacterium]|nr:hemolysin family protein [Candidatus Omnitrophota bacterium]
MDITILIMLLAASAFFSGAETAFFSLDNLRREQIRRLNTSSSDRVMSLLAQPYRLLVTILVGNTLVNIAASSVFASVFLRMTGEKGIGFSIALITLILLIFGEVTPKMFALSHGKRIAVIIALPVKMFGIIFSPVRVILTGIADRILHKLGVKAVSAETGITEREIRSVLSLGREKGVVNRKERDMIEGIFDFKELNAADIMTPRIDIVALDLNSEKEFLTIQMKENQYSRYPVYVHTLDNVVGIVHAKDFLLSPGGSLNDIIRKPIFAPESMRIDDLLEELQKKHTHIAVVTDEYGVTSGVVTIEDILEEIVGEIRDEFDFESPNVHKVDQNSYEIDGRTHIDEVNEELGTDMRSDEVDTIGGFILLKSGKIPRSGYKVKIGGFFFIVDDVSKNRVTKITAERIKKRRRNA